jgi:hypothetical protein
VEPATQPLATVKTHEALAQLLGGAVEACSNYTADCITGVCFHPLIAAAHQAFSDHRPLVLSPDMIWVAVLQGLAHHVRNNPDRLRSHFVAHAGQKILSVVRDDLVPGAPENPWPEVVKDFSRQIHVGIPGDSDWLFADFSTTRDPERIAAEIALLDAVQPYFEYRTYGVCGIPTLTLEGTEDDWQRLAEKVERLEAFDLGWWLDHLRPIAAQFVRAARGDVDLNHWRNIYKRLDAYGGAYANGWLVKLVPYLKENLTGNFTEKNRLLEEPFAPYPPTPAVPKLNRNSRFLEEVAVYPGSLPTGNSAATFTLQMRDGRRRAMEFLGGFLGVTQDGQTKALRPLLGWAVRRKSVLEQLLLQVREHRPGRSLPPPEFNAAVEKLQGDLSLSTIPGDFLAFYRAQDGADLFVDEGGRPLYRILPLASLRPVAPHEPADDQPVDRFSCRPADSTRSFVWVRFADLADGSSLAVNFDQVWVEPSEPMDRETKWKTLSDREVFCVIHCLDQEQDARRAYRVVAWSFTEFLRRALASEGRLFYAEPGFQDRGDPFSPPRWEGPTPADWRTALHGENV